MYRISLTIIPCMIAEIFSYNARFNLSLSNSIVQDYRQYVTNSKWSAFQVNCNIIIMKQPEFCYEILNELLKARNCVKLITSYENISDDFQDVYATVTTILIGRLGQFQEDLKIFVNSQYFTNLGKYKFIICDTVKADKNIYEMSREIWKNKILNFVLLYANLTVKAAIFNPFRDDLDISEASRSGLIEFPEKLRNMNGYPVRLSTTLTATTVAQRYSFDLNFLETFKRFTNCTLSLKNHFVDLMYVGKVFELIASNDAEFCTITEPFGFEKLSKNISEIVTCSDPHMFNNIVALVPKPKMLHNNFLNVVHPYSVVIYLFTSVFLAFLTKFLWKENANLFAFIFTGLGIVVQITKNARKSSTLFTWILASAFLSAIVNIYFLHTMLIPRYENKITSIDDITKKGYKIYSYGFYRNQNVNIVSLSSLKKMVMENRGDSIFIGTYKTLDMYKNVYLNKNINFTYELMEMPLESKYGCFVVKKRSIFFKQIHKIAMIIQEFGVKTNIPQRHKTLLDVNYTLTFKALGPAFIFFLLGLCVATFTFCIEFLSI
ncbi:hypothetical protein ABEB36_007471 [Hypothenemus hampei]|uniref:Uncharacterized protein n=1 Tax=Hypothenemus hampei TaxID=57062 RepID=A0ABD1EU34_HYPHA